MAEDGLLCFGGLECRLGVGADRQPAQSLHHRKALLFRRLRSAPVEEPVGEGINQLGGVIRHVLVLAAQHQMGKVRQ